MADLQPKSRRMRFPRWANFVIPTVLLLVVLGMPYNMLLVGLAGSPSTLNVGYQPVQPMPYSHDLHVYQLGMDCRYCHTTVEDAAFAAIPPTSVCMNCHHAIRKTSPNLEEMYASFRSGRPVEWKKVHDLADFAYFNHSAHINKGVSCVSCHGRVDRMGPEGVYQAETLSMGWCLSCHRDPVQHIRPKDQVFNLSWGYNLTPGQIDQIKSIVLSDAEKPVLNGEELSAERIAEMNKAHAALASQLEEGEALSAEQRRAIGTMLAAQYQVRSPKRMADCSICHR